MVDHLAIASLAFLAFAEMKRPLKGIRAFAAGTILLTAISEALRGFGIL